MGLVSAEMDRYPVLKLSVLACCGLKKTVRKFGQLKRDVVALWMGIDL